MPAAVETYEKMAAFASLREPAWHGLGTVFTKPVSTKEMLDLAFLSGWNLRFVDASEAMDGYNFTKETLHVVRDNPFDKTKKDVLGTVGGRYKIFSNEEIFDFGDTLTDGRRRWETAGSLNGGTTIFTTLVYLDDLVLDPAGQKDTIRKYLLLASTHDGSSTLTAKKVNTRVVCQNTLNVAMGERGDEFRIRHTQGMSTKVEDAKRALGFADAYDLAFAAEAQAMIQAEITKDKFVEITKGLFPEPEDNKRGRLTKWETKVQDLVWVWENGTGSVDNLDNSAWKAFNVLTEHNQWFRQIRSGNVENFLAAGAGFDNVTNAQRNAIFQTVKNAVA
jgi:phage/plasmid-like protein (TIGR03299 family)